MDLESVTLNVKHECIEMNEEDDDGETQGLLRSETQQTQTVFEFNHCVKDDVWKEFVPIGKGEDGKERCRCIHCGKDLVTPTFTSNLWRHLRSCTKKTETKRGGNGCGQDRLNKDQNKCNSVDVVGASVYECSSDREGVSNNTLLKKRQRSSILEGKTRSGMLLGLDVLDCPICFEALTIPIFQVLFPICFTLKCSFSFENVCMTRPD